MRVELLLRTELYALIQKDCARLDQMPATVILSILVEHYKDRLDPETYDTLQYLYSLTWKEQKAKTPIQDATERKLHMEILECDARIKSAPSNRIREIWEKKKVRNEEKLKLYLAQKDVKT